MAKPAKATKNKKRAAVRDLRVKDATKVKGGVTFATGGAEGVAAKKRGIILQ